MEVTPGRAQALLKMLFANVKQEPPLLPAINVVIICNAVAVNVELLINQDHSAHPAIMMARNLLPREHIALAEQLKGHEEKCLLSNKV